MKKSNREQMYYVVVDAAGQFLYARYNSNLNIFETTSLKGAAGKFTYDEAKHARHKIQDNYPEFSDPRIEAID